jgi:histone H3/H4
VSGEFTIAPIRRLLKEAGDLRVSPEAAEEMRNLIGEYGSKLADLAVKNALEEGRKTVLERDIKIAAGRVWNYGNKAEWKKS